MHGEQLGRCYNAREVAKLQSMLHDWTAMLQELQECCMMRKWYKTSGKPIITQVISQSMCKNNIFLYCFLYLIFKKYFLYCFLDLGEARFVFSRISRTSSSWRSLGSCLESWSSNGSFRMVGFQLIIRLAHAWTGSRFDSVVFVWFSYDSPNKRRHDWGEVLTYSL